MPPKAPWSPTAHAFAQHQFSHVANFWKQGRPASFRLEALPGGQAQLNLTFHLPSASEVVPPPPYVSPVPTPQSPIHPLFHKGCFPQRSGSAVETKPPQKKTSSRQRKSYRRSILRRQPKFTFLHFTRDPNLHNPHLHKTHSYTTPKLHGTQIYTNPYFHNLKFTQPDFTQTQIYTLSVARGSSVRPAGRPA